MPKSMVEVERKDTQMCAGTAAHKVCICIYMYMYICIYIYYTYMYKPKLVDYRQYIISNKTTSQQPTLLSSVYLQPTSSCICICMYTCLYIHICL